MLAALISSSIAEIILSIVLASFLAGYLIRRRRRLQPSWLTVRDGRVCLNDKGRAKIVRRGLDITEVEASIAETFEGNEYGEIVPTEAGVEVVQRGTGKGLRLNRPPRRGTEKSTEEK